jgi:hypothetical protein
MRHLYVTNGQFCQHKRDIPDAVNWCSKSRNFIARLASPPPATDRPSRPAKPQQIRRPTAPGPALGAATPQNALFPRLARALFVSVLMHPPPLRKMAGFLGRAGVI